MVGKNQYSTSLVHSHDTDKRATMNMAVGEGVIAAGQDGLCSVMKFKLCLQEEENAAHKDGMHYYNYLILPAVLKRELQQSLTVTLLLFC